MPAAAGEPAPVPAHASSFVLVAGVSYPLHACAKNTLTLVCFEPLAASKTLAMGSLRLSRAAREKFILEDYVDTTTPKGVERVGDLYW